MIDVPDVNWLSKRLQKRAIGRTHKPGRDYIAMKAALAAREEELQKEEAAIKDAARELVKVSNPEAA